MIPRPVLHRSVSRLLAVSLACAAVVACDSSDGAEEEAAAPVVSVRTAVVTAAPFTETIGAIGTVSPRAGHVASVGAPGLTRVTAVDVALGERVARGQVLVELDKTTFQAAAQGAEAALAAAERAHERAQRLAQEGIVPRKDVEQASADLARARAEAVAARRSEELATVRSPLAGVVTRLDAALGASVDANQPLVEVADPTALDVLLSVTPAEAARIRAGERVTLTAGQNASGEALGAGAVGDVAGTVDSATRSVAVRVRVPATRRPLRIGETVFGQIAVAVHANALAVPLEALVPEGDGFKVFVVDAGSIAHAQVVTVGARTDSTAEITNGLRAGDRVVTYGAYGVADSSKVVALPGGNSAKAARSAPATKP